MKKMLYITVNSKPESLSSSKTVGRAFVNRFLARYPEFKMEELDLYKEHIPQLKYQYFNGRNSIVDVLNINNLNNEEKKEVKRIMQLCDQFKSADMYVIAAPMWSLSFPPQLKAYIDCIVLDKRTIKIKKGEKPDGLLNDKKRGFVYIQSSGADLNMITEMFMDKGLHYVKGIMKALGIKNCEELLVDGTGSTEEERLKAVKKAENHIDNVIDKAWPLD